MLIITKSLYKPALSLLKLSTNMAAAPPPPRRAYHLLGGIQVHIVDFTALQLSFPTRSEAFQTHIHRGLECTFIILTRVRVKVEPGTPRDHALNQFQPVQIAHSSRPTRTAANGPATANQTVWPTVGNGNVV